MAVSPASGAMPGVAERVALLRDSANTRGVGIFARLKPSHLRQLAKAMTHVEFQAGELIVGMGDAAAEMYLVMEGSCVIDMGEVDQMGTGATMTKGAAFGELALLAGVAKRHALHNRSSRLRVIRGPFLTDCP